MATINSVLGPLDTANLGFTLSHEHVIVSSAGIPTLYPEFLDWDKTKEEAAAELSQAYDGGVRTIVDVSTIDLGRDVHLLEEVSRRSRVHFIAATGVWRQVPRAFVQATPDQLAALFIREIRVGMQHTSIKAGIIKVANEQYNLPPEEENILRGAARAQKATGVPISTHTAARERVGEQQVRIFEEEGVDLNRVYIGHSNDTTDMDYLLGLLRRGVWLGLDRYPGGGGGEANPNWEVRTETLKKLIDAGFAHRLMLGHDWSTYSTNSQGERRIQRRRNNPHGYLFITRQVLPRLRELGVSEKVVNQLMVDNPRRFFEGAK